MVSLVYLDVVLDFFTIILTDVSNDYFTLFRCFTFRI